MSASSSSDDEEDAVPVLVEVLPEPTQQPTTTTFVSSSPPENDDDRRKGEPLSPCPVTILSGFLGSGKTTLIQYILRSPDHGLRIAVIENEYANSREGLSVESLLVRDGGSHESTALQDLIELPNGCLCCTVKDSLVVTLEQLLLRASSSSNDGSSTTSRSIDAILIECSGLANPGPVAAAFWLDAALESRLRLAGIVTVVDALHVRRQLRDTVEASLQIAYADRILLNKVDLLASNDDDDDPVQAVEDLIRTLHPTAPLQRTTFAAVPDLDWILNAGAATEPMDLVLPACCGDAGHHHSCHHHHHNNARPEDVVEEEDATAARCAVCTGHTLDVSTVSLTVAGSVDLTRVHQWLAALLWPPPDAAAETVRLGKEEPPQEVVAPAAAIRIIRNNSNQGSGSTEEQDDAAATTRLPLPHQTTTNNNNDQQQQEIFRIKGILSVRHGPKDDNHGDDEEERWIHPVTRVDRRRYIAQAVHDLWDIYPASGGPDTLWDNQDDHHSEDDCFQPQQQQHRTSQLVVIGRHLQGEALQRALEACRWVGEA